MSLPFTPDDLAEIARAAAAAAWEEGLSVLKPDGHVVPIPLVAEPELLSRDALAALARESRAILSGAVKLATALLRRGEAGDREALLGPFEGLEAEAMGRLFEEAPCPALVARVDFLRDERGEPHALELNATIPAMPGYADLAAHHWLRAAAARRGLSPRQANDLVARQGSNVEKLRETLVAYYRSRGGTGERPSIAIVARPGDAQIGELRRIAAHFRQMGHACENLVPATCEPERWDVLYRHVWAHNTPADAPFARALRAPSRFVLANPVNGLLEAKALFARLSEAAEDDGLARLAGLDAEERAAAGRLPWTRLLDAALAPKIAADRERYVLKRSWDYGGKSVHLGSETPAAEWPGIVERAAADGKGGGFVVQQRIVATKRPATRVVPDGTARAELYRDVSTYSGLGPVAPDGSVVRAAASPVVNILGGGGLAPVIAADVAALLG
jgi:hypothetical protein